MLLRLELPTAERLAAARADEGGTLEFRFIRLLLMPLAVGVAVGEGPRAFKDGDEGGLVAGRRPMAFGGGGFLIAADMTIDVPSGVLISFCRCGVS